MMFCNIKQLSGSDIFYGKQWSESQIIHYNIIIYIIKYEPSRRLILLLI